MGEGVRIYIVGCAKTGTTLLQRLFCAFDVEVILGEIPLGKLIEKKGHVVAKRTWNQLMSNVLAEAQVRHFVRRIKKYNIKLVYMHRNKVDTLKSTNGYVSEGRYDACQRQYEQHKDIVDYTADYDRLIAMPDTVQKEIADVFSLRSIYKFSDYPAFVPEDQISKKDGVYKLRKIGEGY